MEKVKLNMGPESHEDSLTRLLLDLNVEKKRFKTMINCMADGVMLTDENLVVTHHNPALMRLLGRPWEVKGPFAVREIIDHAPLIKTLQDIQSGDLRENEMISHEIKAGGYDLRTVSAPVLGVDRKVFWSVTGAVTVFQDITAFKKLDRAKSDFVNLVAHELRSPLVAVRQLHSVLLDGLAGTLEEKQQELIHRGSQKIDALLQMIGDLLDLAKMEESSPIQQKVLTDIGPILEEMVALMRPRAESRGLRLTHSCINVEPIYADPKGLEEILNNLLSNAINYSLAGGEVTVTVCGREASLEIIVQDEGVGIPAEEIPKIFDRFYRVKHPKTRSVTGTGLGLAIVKRVVDAHQGRIEVESIPDKGTVFKVQLPIGDDDETKADQSKVLRIQTGIEEP
jgi:two-component system phosphate regulon sensor histidine kinase PhoR